MRGWWKDTGRLEDMLEANRLILDNLLERVEGELIDSQVDGRVVIEPGARLERTTVRGPAIVGAGARLSDCYVGPYTAIGERCTISGAGGRALDPARRLHGRGPRRAHGVLAARAQRDRAPRRPPAARLPLHGRRQLRHLDPVRPELARTGRRPGCSACDVAARAASAPGTSSSGWPGPSSTSPTRRPSSALCSAIRARRGRQLRRLDRRRRRRDPSRAGARGQRRRRRQPRARGGGGGRAARARLHRLRLRRRRAARRGRRAAPLRRVRPDRPALGVRRRRKLAGERQVLAASARHTVVRSAWLFGVDGRNFVETMLRLAREGAAERGRRRAGRDRPDRLPHLDRAISPPRCSGCSSARSRGLVHLAGTGEVSWNGFAQEIFRQAEVSCRVEAATQRADGPPGAAPGVVGAASPSATTCCRCPPGGRAGGVPRGAGWDDARMRLLVCGGAGFIGSTFARQRLREHGDEVTVLDKLTYAGREENLHDLAERPRASASCAARSRTPSGRGGDRGRRAGGDRQLRRRDARRPLDRRARRVRVARTRSAPTCCSRPPASTALRYVQVSTDEVYGSIEEGTFTEESPLRPSSPYSATKTGADLLVQSYFHTYGLPA